MNLYLKRFLLEGTLTGFVVGLVVSVATTGDLGAERAVFGFLVVPGITAALLTRLFQSKHPLSGKRPIVRLLFVAYLTTFPLFGLLAGGANVPLAALAGACFGTVWASLAVLVTS